jgi:hypothetical protein
VLDKGIFNPGRLAWLPLAFMLEQDALQATVADQDGSDAAYQEVMTASYLTYQLHSYHMLVRRRFGDEVAGQVKTLQCEIFEREQAGAGAAVVFALNLVETALQTPVVGGKAGCVHFALPAEQSVALALLTGLPASPDYHAGHAQAGQSLEQLPGIDAGLAGFLEQGKHAVLETFMPLFSVPLTDAAWSGHG